jgi:virulence-associated protein VagC
MKEMVLPEDEIRIYNETQETRLEDTNQQLKKWLLRWKPVIEHSMKREQEFTLQQTNQQRQEYQENSQQ